MAPSNRDPLQEMIYNTLVGIKEDIGKLTANSEYQSKAIEIVSDSHYKLKNDFTVHKTKVVTISGVIGTFFGGLFGAIVAWFTKHI